MPIRVGVLCKSINNLAEVQRISVNRILALNPLIKFIYKKCIIHDLITLCLVLIILKSNPVPGGYMRILGMA